jgi:hypothetical protein
VLADLIPGDPGVLTTDRYPAYDHLSVSERQVCWTHLRRDFQAMIDRRNDGSAVGEDLLMYADILLGQWKRVRDGTLNLTTGGRAVATHRQLAPWHPTVYSRVLSRAPWLGL